MTPLVIVRRDSYHDSVLLMRVSQKLKARDGVEDAVVAMGTPHNRALLAQAGFSGEALDSAGPNDLLIAVKATEAVTARLEAEVDGLLRPNAAAGVAEARPATLAAAWRDHPEINLVLISVPGEHAGREARRALAQGRHVMVFSDNMPVEEEIALKSMAVERELLLMGPDCGTAIINGKPLAFANVVRRGPIGIVGASGTGIQEISCHIHRLGSGVSQAIGTGGRDLSDAVGGAMTLLGIKALAADPRTEVLVVVSKPPSPEVAKKVIAALEAVPVPSVVHFVGAKPGAAGEGARVVTADTLAGTAEEACRLSGLAVPRAEGPPAEIVAALAGRLAPGASLRGLFCGGTTGYEALVILERAGFAVGSNLRHGEGGIDDPDGVSGHLLLDLGDDLFTRGRPHPMIEPELRNERLAVEMENPEVGLLLFDLVLGYGSHDDPAGVLARGVERARATAGRRGVDLVAVTSITGTREDPQDAEVQRRVLESAGITVMPDNRRAAELAAAVLGRGNR